MLLLVSTGKFSVFSDLAEAFNIITLPNTGSIEKLTFTEYLCKSKPFSERGAKGSLYLVSCSLHSYLK